MPTIQPCSTLVEILQNRAVRQPDQVLYTFLKDGVLESGQLTYGELDRKAREIATYLQSQSIQPGQRVLLSYPLTEGLAFIEAFFGCLYAGVVAVTAWPPMNKSLRSELQYKAIDSTASLGLTAHSLHPKLRTAFQNPTLVHLNWTATDTLCVDPNHWQPQQIDSQTLAYLQYTSGSTGVPKGAMISHGNLLHNSAVIAECFGTTPDDRGLIWLPLYHDMGLIGGVLQPLYTGFPVYLMSPLSFIRKPWRWLQAISKYQATVSGGPNFAYDLCLEKAQSSDLGQLDLSTWAVAFTGAEPVQARTLEQFAATFAFANFKPNAFCPCYGMAETTVMTTSHSRLLGPQVLHLDPEALANNQVHVLAEKSGYTVVSCGQVTLGQHIHIVDPDTCNPCNSDQIGEIWISGESVAQGYWNNPKATAEAFQGFLATTGEGPFLRTGDFGFLQAEQLYITGRLKDIIVIWGRNLHPHHLEQAISQEHPALATARSAAFSLQQEGEEKLVIVQELPRKLPENFTNSDIIATIRQTIFKQFLVEPQHIVLVKAGAIPTTPTGKTQRTQCRQKWQSGQLNIHQSWHQTKENTIDWEIAFASS